MDRRRLGFYDLCGNQVGYGEYKRGFDIGAPRCGRKLGLGVLGGINLATAATSVRLLATACGCGTMMVRLSDCDWSKTPTRQECDIRCEQH